MRDMNKVTLIGNLGTDPEMRYTATGIPVGSFRVAVHRVLAVKDRETEWFTVVVWNKLAESCNQYLAKGRRVYVEGRLQTRSWIGQDGQPKSRMEIIANDVIFLDAKPEDAANVDDGLVELENSDDVPF